MKNKYQRLNKKEKKELLAEYKKTSLGKSSWLRLVRLNITGIVGIIYSLSNLIYDYVKNNLGLIDYLILIPLYLISLFFILMAHRIKVKNLNEYALKKL